MIYLSNTNFVTSKDVLNDRYLRKIEALTAVAKDPHMPYQRVLAWIGVQKDLHNKGNSNRQMRIYLTEWALAGYGFFKQDTYHLTDAGAKVIKQEQARVAAMLRPIDWGKMSQEIDNL